MINNLPVELLAEIFLYCMAPFGTLTRPAPNEYSPLLTCFVCTHWWAITMQTPALWASFRLALEDDMASEVVDRRVALFDLWLSRSGTVPLTLHVEVPEHIAPPTLDRICSIIISHSGHLYHFWLWSHIQVLYHLASHPTTRFPLFRNIALAIIGDDMPNRSLPLFQDICGLDTATIVGRACLEVMRDIPTSHLTLLSLAHKEHTPTSAVECFDLLRRCPRLQVCQLFLDGGLSAHGERVELPQLQELMLRGGGDFNAFFEHVRAPRLEVITLRSINMELSRTAFLGFLQCSGGSMKDIEFLGVGVLPSELIVYLHLTPVLERLSICELPHTPLWTDEVLTAIHYNHLQPQTLLVPHLTYLSMDLLPPYMNYVLMCAIDSRWCIPEPMDPKAQRPARLVEVVLCVHPMHPLNDDALKRIEEMRGEGLNVFLEEESHSDEDLSEDDE